MRRLSVAAIVVSSVAGWERFESFSDEQLGCSASGDFAKCVEARWARCLSGSSSRELTGSSGSCWRTCDQSAGDSVWTTVVNGNTVNYTTMAMVQVLSVRLFSCYRHVTLVTPEVKPEVRKLLRSVGSEVREAQHIYWARQPSGVIEGYRWLFSKLNLWRPGVVGHARAVFIDADTFLTDPGADALQEHACRDESADFCSGIDYVANLIQGGILVARPSQARYASMLAALDNFTGGPNAFVPDMDFLTNYFRIPQIMKTRPRGARAALLRRAGLQLFNVNNVTSRRQPVRFDPCPSISRLAGFPADFLERNKTRHTVSRYSLWHHCGAFKLDRVPRCQPSPPLRHLSAASTAATAVEAEAPRSSETARSLSERATPAKTADGGRLAALPHPFCGYRVMALYQWLQRRANPCSEHGGSADECRRAPACRWCSEVVRCAPRERSCHLRDAASRALKARSSSRVDQDWLRTGWCSFNCDPKCCAAKRKWMPKAARRAMAVLAGNLSDGASGALGDATVPA